MIDKELEEAQEEIWWELFRRMNEDPDQYLDFFMYEAYGE